MSNWLKLLMFVATATLGPADETAQDWPEFRGPTGQGVARAEHLPLHWSPTKNIAWKQKIPGNGWSSPLVSAGRIYLTTAVPEANGAQASKGPWRQCVSELVDGTRQSGKSVHLRRR